MKRAGDRRMLSRRQFLWLAGLSAMLAGCGARQSSPLPSPSSPPPSPTPRNTPTPASTSTLTPSPTWTPTPTPYPTPTATSTPPATPTATPTPTRGPLRVISLIHGPARALVVDHVLKRFGIVSTSLRVDLNEAVPDLREYDAVVFAGGEHRPDQFELPFFRKERERVLPALEARVPILGICLGHQLLAYWLGGQVKQGRWEIGWLPVAVNEAGLTDPLLAGLGHTFFAFLWHGDQITQLPDGAAVLASTERCPVQAYRLSDYPVWGVQFNPQYDPVIAEGVIRAAPSLARGGVDVEAMIATGYREYNDLAGRLFANFLRFVEQN